MNPVLLPGPSFLFFYLVFGCAVLYVLHLLLKRQASQVLVNASELAKDPYKIAFLRGGKSAAISVATIALHDRGLLAWENGQLQVVNKESILSVQRPIEKALLQYYLVPANIKSIIHYPPINNACNSYQHELKAQGLLRASTTLLQRLLPCVIATCALVGVSYIKINFAYVHGHSNVGFLMILTVIFSLFVLMFFFKRLTAAGSQLLSNLQSLFSLLKLRAAKLQAGGETNEAALVMAVYGLHVLSESQFPLIAQLRPANTSDSSSSGSSCSSSSGSSCGSSCGGGGCGGCGS